MKQTNLPQVLSLKEMWEKFDINVVENSFHEQVSYSCPSALTWIGGKENVTNYLKMVLEGFRTLNFFIGIEIEYEVIKKTKNYYSLLIHQIEANTKTKCRLEVETLEDKIFSIEMK